MRAIHPVVWTSILLFAVGLLACTSPPMPATTPAPVAQLTPVLDAATTPQPPSPTLTPTAVAATLTPGPSAADLSSFSYVRWMDRLSQSEGWVLTDSLSECGVNASCRARFLTTEGLIYTERLLWTEDAGASWSDITPAGLSNCPPPDICTIVSPPVFFDPSRARIALIRGQEMLPPTTLSFMYTENGGRTWGLWKIDDLECGRVCPGFGCLADVQLVFSDPRNGWLSASASLGMGTEALYLYRTRDGGQSWTALVKSSTGDAGGPGWTPTPMVHRLSFIDASTGWVVGGWRWDSGTLLATRNGADSWQPVGLDVPEAFAEMARDHSDPEFFTRDSGVLPVRFYGRDDSDQVLGFYTTTDAGASWSLTGTLEDPELARFDSRLRFPWSAIDETTWFVAVSHSRQYLTRDRGQTWEGFAAEGLGEFDLVEVQFASVTEGWGLAEICASRVPCADSIFATHDGGRTWSPVPLPP